MMYPVLAKVRYEELGRAKTDGVSDRRFFGVSLFLSWVVGPLLMFTLAWLFLADQPAYRTGVIIVGLARCIAMVLIWNDLAKGDRDRAAVLVVFNALFQVAAFSLLGYFYLTVLPGWLGLDTQGFQVGIWEVARTVLIFLGIPLTAGYLTRRIGLKRKGRDWYEQKFIPRIGPITLYGLLFTIVLLFAIQGDKITSQPLDVAMIALPLLAYFARHVDRRVRDRQADRLPVPADGEPVLHRRLERLRAGDRRRRRRLRRHLRAGARRRRRAADRGARARRARLRRTLGKAVLANKRQSGMADQAGAGLIWPRSLTVTAPAACGVRKRGASLGIGTFAAEIGFAYPTGDHPPRRRIGRQLRPRLDPRRVDESAQALSPNGVTTYVHILAERFTRERLTGLAQSKRRVAKSTAEVVSSA